MVLPKNRLDKDFKARMVLTLDDSNNVTLNGEGVRLTRAQAQLFRAFGERSPRTLTDEDVILVTRRPNEPAEEHDVSLAKVLVSKLRKQLATLTDAEIIETVWGVGYRLPNDIVFMSTYDEGIPLVIPSELMDRITQLAFAYRITPKEMAIKVIKTGGRILESELPDEDEDDPWA